VKGSDLIRVGLGLRYPALEAGVRALLSADPDIAIVNDANEAADVHILTAAASLAVTEVPSNENGLRAVLVLGAEGLDVQRMWRLGMPWGVLPLEVASEELCAAVRAVAAGLVVGTPQLLTHSAQIGHEPGPLTEREVQILGLLSTGLANKQVAAELGISEHTVKFHVSSIYTKLNVGNRAEAVREGLRHGLIAL
jgi:DNA-binding CsgD family transcriptional regulator